MCLDSVVKKLFPSTLVESGYKSFHGGSAGNPDLLFENYPLNKSKKVPLDAWITAEGTKIETYDAGFHIYTNERDFKTMGRAPGAMHRVYFRKAHTVGRQDQKDVVVAREMYVPSDPEAWPPRS